MPPLFNNNVLPNHSMYALSHIVLYAITCNRPKRVFDQSVQFSAYFSKFIIKMMKTKYYNGNTILKYCFTIWYEIAQSIWSLIMVMLIKYLNSFYCDIFSFKYQNTRLQSERLNEYSFHVTLTKRKDKKIKLRGKQYLLCICYEVLKLTLQWRSAVWLFISRVS